MHERFRLLRRSRSGQALVEFLYAIPVLMLLVVGIFEFSRQYYTRLTVRHAVSEAARFAVTGQQLVDPETGDPMSRAESIIRTMNERATGLTLKVEEIQVDPSDGGGPGEIVQIRATYRAYFLSAPLVRSFAPEFTEFTVATTVRNEPVF